ncbi:EAL domain-containing protein [Oribacterium sp. WCC10]|uniref:EAL domain-containing protein n=1 Tax=Oribacterium sp. WCC10 TaxID=1855343 RepID=UPI0008EF09BB|nr:EAL domain-containing protein [Oribacterium sp. WCC10]SFG65768.1 EAL domain, c-di-GMP-specific phosphodiesterase class I (or its enzymatically inactive variant) [Oribacterium sp. WCC10]
MFNWISPFNYDFAIAAIPIQIILLVFYGFRRNLPIWQSTCFWLVMFSNLVMTTADIISCEMNEIWNEFPLWVMYAINHAYFLGFIIRGWALFAYTSESTHAYKKGDFVYRIITNAPAAVAVTLILSTPWTSAIYTIAEDGYHNCSLYQTIYFSTYFYIFTSLLLIVLNWRKLSRRMQGGLLSYNLLLLFGILIRKQFYHMLVTSYFSILCIIIIFLTSENPDLHRDNRTLLLNKDALDLIGYDYWEKKIPFSLLTIAIHNYEASKTIYGVTQLNDSLRTLSSWLSKSYPRNFVFYTRNGTFVILIRGNLQKEPEVVIDDWKAKFDELKNRHFDILPLKVSVMLIPSTIIADNVSITSDLARYAMNSAFSENHKGNYVFTQDMVETVNKRKAVEKAIKKAMNDNSFEVYFQPIYSTKEEKIVGAEALARLKDSELGFISPADFIKIAEKNGDIMEIGRQIFEKVCIFLGAINVERLGVQFINVNLSPVQFMNTNLAGEFSDIADKYDVSMDIFDFEVTESTVEDYEMIHKQVLDFQSKGSELSLDDFGTGSSNLSSLMSLPIHVVKIDMSFVHSYFNGKDKFLPDLIRLFRNANMKVVVEGIETLEMKEAIAEMGCEYEQGYFFSKPVPPEEFVSYMEKMMKENSGDKD